MRVRTGLVVLLVAVLVVPWSSREDDPEETSACPTLSAEEMWETEEGRAYLRELGKMMGESVDGPEDLDRLGHDESDSYATYFTVTCDD